MNVIHEDTFESTKLLVLTMRHHAWAKNGEAQEHADARWVLRDHFRLFKKNEELEKQLYYICNDCDGYYVTWQDRAEDLEKRLDAANNILWMAEKYIKSLPVSFPTDEDKHHKAVYDAAMEIIDR